MTLEEMYIQLEAHILNELGPNGRALEECLIRLQESKMWMKKAMLEQEDQLANGGYR